MSERYDRNNITASTPLKGVTAREVYAKSDRRIISDIVLEQVKLIDAQINIAHGSGFNRIKHELPTNFSINNLDKSDGQTMIYSELLMMYKNPEPTGKGFDDVTIHLGKKPYISIGWLNGMDQDEKKARLLFINSCMIRK